MGEYDVLVDGISTKRMGFLVVQRPNISAPLKNTNEYDIPGRNGKLYEQMDTYDDVEISISFNYMSNKDMWHHMFRQAKKIFMNAEEIVFSDDNDYYHIVKKVVIGTNERNSLRIGRFDVTFTVDPYYYLKSGKIKMRMNNSETLFNQYDKTAPVYYIKGEGICTLNVNGHECTCNVGQNMTIDTFLKIAYRDDGTLMNAQIDGDYDELTLVEGDNEISITSGFELEIKPNWRCL